MQEEYSNLPDLNIKIGDDIAGNMEFVEAYITHDALLSDGKEFIHDHLSHVLNALDLMNVGAERDRNSNRDLTSYKAEKFSRVMQIIQLYRKIMLVKHGVKSSNFSKEDIEKYEKFPTISKGEIDKIETFLGANVDFIAATHGFGEINLEPIRLLSAIWQTPQWKNRRNPHPVRWHLPNRLL